MVKRSLTTSPSPAPSLADENTPPSTPPPKKSPKKTPRTPKTKSESAIGGMVSEDVEGWTPSKKARFTEELIAVALASVNRDDLAARYGVTKKQIDNAWCKGKSNLRTAVIKAAERY